MLTRKSMRRTGPTSDVVNAILERACYCCEVCGSPCADQRGTDWSIHHRRPRGMGGTNWPGINLPSNLMLVCGSGTTLCHGVIENYRAGAVAAGWLVLSRTDPATTPVLITRDRWCYLSEDATYVDAPPPAGRCGMNIRWQCPRGHFVAVENVRSLDHIDPAAYHGVSAAWEYTCRGCEQADVGPYMYFESPRLVDISGGAS